MIYREALRTRGPECGPDRWVTLPSVISYMESCRWEWLRQPQLGLIDAIHQGHGFYVLNQTIAMSRRFGQGTDAHTRGVLRSVGRTRAGAAQDIVRDDGVLLAHCVIDGVWVGPTGRLARIPALFKETLSTVELTSERGVSEPREPDSLFNPPQPLRPGELDLTIEVDIPDQTDRREVEVRSSDCDMFRHVNAANYLRYVADSLALQGASASIHRAALKYVGQARATDKVQVLTWHVANERWGAAVVRGDDILFRALVETEHMPHE
ncbi:MAG: acyl-CoA thioesterase FadM [Kiritimatiellia bacterium]|jgi:acyl-CoA thioesterase FadM